VHIGACQQFEIVSGKMMGLPAMMLDCQQEQDTEGVKAQCDKVKISNA